VKNRKRRTSAIAQLERTLRVGTSWIGERAICAVIARRDAAGGVGIYIVALAWWGCCPVRR